MMVNFLCSQMVANKFLFYIKKTPIKEYIWSTFNFAVKYNNLFHTKSLTMKANSDISIYPLTLVTVQKLAVSLNSQDNVSILLSKIYYTGYY